MEKPAILLLERDANVIEKAQQCLADEVELHVVNTVDLAVRVAARRPVVVAVLDATMAGLSPSETVNKLRAQKPAMRIIFLAEPAFDLDRRYGVLGSMLRKPLTQERLEDAIRNALRLRNMSEGVERMRSSSGTYRAVRLTLDGHHSPSPSGLSEPPRSAGHEGAVRGSSNPPPTPGHDLPPHLEPKPRGDGLSKRPPIPREEPDEDSLKKLDGPASPRSFSPPPVARDR